MSYKLTIYQTPRLDIYKEFTFETEAELNAASNTASYLLLFMQDEAKIMDDYSNMFVSQVFIDGVWEDFR